MSQHRISKPTEEIVAAFRSGNTDLGCSLFQRAGGDLFVFRHGYDELGYIIEAMPHDQWRRQEVLLGAVVLFLAKRGRARRAQAYLHDPDIAFKRTFKSDIYQLWLAIHLGDPVGSEQLDHWLSIETQLPVAEPLLEGLYYNCILVFLVRHGRLKEARTAGQRAIAAFRDANHIYLEHFIHLHLADLATMEGRLRDARRGLDTAVDRLEQSGRIYGNEREIIEVSYLTLDYEIGRFHHIPERAGRLRDALIGGDSWAEIFEQLARITVKAKFFMSGREAAMGELEMFRSGYAGRHGGTSEVLSLLEITIDWLDQRFGDATVTGAHLDLSKLQSPIAQALLKDVEGAVPAAQEMASELEGPRFNIVSTLQEAARATRNNRRRLVEQAFWRAAREGHAALFLEHRDALSGLSSRLASGRFARGHVQLARLARHTVRSVENSYWIPAQLRDIGVTRRQFRVITALQSGATNKEIARSLAISEAAVKYHLTNLYRLLGVSRRGQLLEKIYENHVLPISYPF